MAALTDFLEKKFPGLFDNIPYTCGNGWFGLLYEFCEKLSAMTEDFEISAVFIETDGTLALLLQPREEELDEPIEVSNLVTSTEEKSAHICEVCGERGECREFYVGGFLDDVRIRCDRHRLLESRNA